MPQYLDYETDPPMLKYIDDPSKLFSKIVESIEWVDREGGRDGKGTTADGDGRHGEQPG
jgi:hypothetical protein